MVEHEGERFTLPASKIDEAFLDVLHLPLAAGRNFPRIIPVMREQRCW